MQIPEGSTHYYAEGSRYYMVHENMWWFYLSKCNEWRISSHLGDWFENNLIEI
ncbi:hypothetical protein S140_13 [Shewanella sp. phage 1/40]|uniref:hypothetical protein n=1 Tax=Shewanella phage 1/4 TaxID=1458859 RepID=UPI0004F6A179|nr:hypothetical protein S14_16 [Shewanella sp. phage 1/4]YP_009104014.1 hypothetical protein S140_13 [Shewanella sp. phage 1/40]AHK11128.1 hypothetical protein S14_16 [Shewanella sp. phage 1/4]AHK11423.1 hypothetical protein S140_13 [Shewanella sp. phage 1/40]